MNRRFLATSAWLGFANGMTRNLHTAGTVGRGNFFAYLSLPKSPDLDAADVQRSYHKLQRRVHPDLVNVQDANNSTEPPGGVVGSVTTSTTTDVANVDDSMYANLSYETLRDPFRRCKYLSRLSRAEAVKGRPLDPLEEEMLMSDDDGRNVEDNKRLQDAGENMSLPEEFLAEMMAANEYVFSPEETNEYRDRLVILIAHLEERHMECYEATKAQWDAEDFQGFRRSVLEWTYVRNILEKAKDCLGNINEAVPKGV
ncbi:chaperone protein DNAj, putative [Trypanosoma brucei gambiense DAL972]|uniref:Chaperone protein DNAj, putative n=1 Tax=Trypanosoma brucei gambiense (strain MHOM/CI/86/DAL972) TaxID=679716 RepID=C9ZK58_TRYB9|nr:chaperone protein DNAj, putative [Trypanosoma brucei gambiense DAL972]CBH09822.1 chaperone protein DNAj, putative [Trypanosoma brucei gambiense DAL972]|eukprot:XP_011772115.1 chaperone protein DNAj, putative [Trypanosoma brucei gambiense DAL972]